MSERAGEDENRWNKRTNYAKMAINTLKFDEDAFKSSGAWRKWFLSVSGMPKNNVTCLQCYGLKSIDLVSCVILYWSCHFLRLVFYWLCRSFRPELVSPRGPRCSRSDACVHTFVRCYWLLVCYWYYHCLHWNHLGVKRTNASKCSKKSATIACCCAWKWHWSILWHWSFSSNGLREWTRELFISYSRSEQQIKQCHTMSMFCHVVSAFGHLKPCIVMYSTPCHTRP